MEQRGASLRYPAPYRDSLVFAVGRGFFVFDDARGGALGAGNRIRGGRHATYSDGRHDPNRGSHPESFFEKEF